MVSEEKNVNVKQNMKNVIFLFLHSRFAGRYAYQYENSKFHFKSNVNFMDFRLLE